MSERPKEHDWKSCVPRKGTEGSNPSLCAKGKACCRVWRQAFCVRKSAPVKSLYACGNGFFRLGERITEIT